MLSLACRLWAAGLEDTIDFGFRAERPRESLRGPVLCVRGLTKVGGLNLNPAGGGMA